MKKVLQRGFKPAKCKTALQMANSRLKILKNKKEIQIKQLRRELAQLLEAGHTPTARIRVEHVVREEKTVAAYELIGIYCELLVVRLGVIESQKNCPIDLKEAVTSVLFASQRLSDVPELAEICKQFTTKYRKDFATSAIELRPDSGVSRLLVEKLSAKAPDGPTKVKILMGIATEHNVVWEDKSFVEPDPRDAELLSGASTFQSASSVNMEQPQNVQAPATVNVQHGSSERRHSQENSYGNDGRSSSRSNDVASGKADDYYHQNPRPSSRSRADEGECRNPNHGNESSSSRSKQRWETEFVTSTDAARAAAEAAERASFAARAAAELSSKERMTRQDSTESHMSSATTNFRNEPSHRRNSSNVQSEDYYSPRQNVRMQYEDTDRTQQDKNRRANESEIPPVRQSSERHSMENTRNNGSFGKKGREKQSSEDETDLNGGYSEHVHLRKQSSRASSRSHSGNYSDENGIGSEYMKSPRVVEDNIFATEYDHQSQSSFKDIDTHDHRHDDSTGDTFDDYGSYFDKPKLDAEDEYDHGVGFSLLGSKTSTVTPAPTASWSFKGDHGNRSSSSQVFQESPLFDDVSTSPPASYHELDRHAEFDNYGANSESEDDDQPRHGGNVSGLVEERMNLTSDHEVSEPVGHEFFPVDSEEHKDDLKTLEESDSESDGQSVLKFKPISGGFRNKKTLPPYIMATARNEPSYKSEIEHTGTDNVGLSMTTSSSSRKDIHTKKASNSEKRPSSTPPYPSSSDDDDSEIQLRGRRTETKPRSSYRPSHVNHDDSEEEELSTQPSYRNQESTHKATRGVRDHNRQSFKTPASPSYRHSHVNHNDSEEEELSTRSSYRNQERTHKPTTGVRDHNRPSFKTPASPSYRHSHVNHNDSEEEELSTRSSYRNQERTHKPTTGVRDHNRPSFKTPASPSYRHSHVNHNDSEEEELSTRSSYRNQERTHKPTTGVRDHNRPNFKTPASPSYEDQEEVQRDAARVNAKPIRTTGYSIRTKGQVKDQQKRSFPVTPTKTNQEPQDQPSPKSTSDHKTVNSNPVPETARSPDPETPSRASHVHPNLPDYDDIFARLGALRGPNRR